MFNEDLSSKETDKFVVSNNITKDDIEIKIINKLEINEQQKFNGLSKEEVLKYATDPKWVRIRWILFILFWILWIGMLVTAILLIVFTPKCPPRPDLKWWNEDCFYQIEVTKFKDSNGDGVGDLKGVTEKLDYLSGVGYRALFLNEIVNPNSIHDVDPRVGDVESLFDLRKQLKERGMRFVIDVTLSIFNVTADFEQTSKAFLKHWLTNYADGVRFLNTDSKAAGFDFATDSDVNKVIYGWRSQVDEISKKTLREKVLLFDLNKQIENANYLKANPSFIVNKNFVLLNEQKLENPKELKATLNAYYTNLNTSWPNVMFKTYGSKASKTHIPLEQVLLYLLRGTPIAYYGDEIGLEQGNEMKWDNSPGCGFTSNKTLAKNTKCENSVDWLMADGAGHTLVEFIEKLNKLRREPAFLWGEQTFTQLDSPSVFSFIRKAEGFDAYLVAIHLNPKDSSTAFVNFKEHHDLNGLASNDAHIAQYYSLSGNFNPDFKVNAKVTFNSIVLKYGDVLILKLA